MISTISTLASPSSEGFCIFILDLGLFNLEIRESTACSFRHRLSPLPIGYSTISCKTIVDAAGDPGFPLFRVVKQLEALKAGAEENQQTTTIANIAIPANLGA